MSKIIYLHFGLRKAASGSFQKTCYANKDILNKINIHYPTFTIQGKKQMGYWNHSPTITSLFANKPESSFTNILLKTEDVTETNKEYLKQLELCLERKENLILSAEGIGLLPNHGMVKLRKILSRNSNRIKPFCLIRSPYAFHCSVSQQKIKSGHYVNFEKFNSQIREIEALKAVFPETEFYSFNKACTHSYGPVGYLFEKIGITNQNFKFKNRNEGLSNIYVRTQNVLNKIEPKFKNRTLNKNHRKIQETNGDKFRLTQSELEQIKKELNIENHYFVNFFGEEYIDREIKTNIKISNEDFIRAYFTHVNWESNFQLTDSKVNLILENAEKFKIKNKELSNELINIAHIARPKSNKINNLLKKVIQVDS